MSCKCTSVAEHYCIDPSISALRWQLALQCRRKHRIWIRDFIAKTTANRNPRLDQSDMPKPNFAADLSSTSSALSKPVSLELTPKAVAAPITSPQPRAHLSAPEPSPPTSSSAHCGSKPATPDIVSALIRETDEVQHAPANTSDSNNPSHVSGRSYRHDRMGAGYERRKCTHLFVPIVFTVRTHNGQTR